MFMYSWSTGVGRGGRIHNYLVITDAELWCNSYKEAPAKQNANLYDKCMALSGSKLLSATQVLNGCKVHLKPNLQGTETHKKTYMEWWLKCQPGLQKICFYICNLGHLDSSLSEGTWKQMPNYLLQNLAPKNKYLTTVTWHKDQGISIAHGKLFLPIWIPVLKPTWVFRIIS